MAELRDMIREILIEEMSRMGDSIARTTEESVAIRSSADLNKFALRLLKSSDQGDLRARMEAGRHRFVLNQDTDAHAADCAHEPKAPAPRAPAQAQFLRGLVTEREVAALADDTSKLVIGKSVCLTPLARDQLVSRGIKLERKN